MTANLTDSKPVICSVVAGQGISIVKDGNALLFNNTVDPATGLSNRVVVTEASDFAGTLDSTKQYFLDGIIDMGAQTIEVPAGGLNITGYTFDLSKLICSDAAYTLFTSPVTGSGNIIDRDFAIEVTGSGSQVYDLFGDT